MMKYFPLFLLLFLVEFAAAQMPAGLNPSSIGSGGGGGAPKSTDVARDTSDVYYFFASNLGQDYLLSDTLLAPYFLQYDPIRSQDLPFAHIGLPGAAAHPLTSQIPFRRGLDIGLHAYDLYRASTDKIRYYKVEQAYTRAFFSQGATQEETTFGAEFAREFEGNFTLSFDYQRQSNEGFYENQFAQNSALTVNGWIHSDNNRYQIFFNTISNSNDHLENGGISDLPTNADDEVAIDNPVLAGTYLSSAANAQNRYAERSFNFKHFFKLNRNKTDSLNKGTRALTLVHEATYANNTYKFTDLAPDADSSFYHSFSTDTRGLRHYIQHQKIENSFAVSTFKTKPGADAKVTDQKDLLEIGLLHRFSIIKQEPEEYNLTEVFATGRWQIAPGERLKLNTYAHLGLLGSAGDYRVDGDLSFDLGKLGQLSASATQQLAQPTIIQNKFYVSQKLVYENDFRKSLSTELAGTYSLPKIGFKGEVSYQLLNNYIYFDTLALAQQADEAISVGRITIQQNVKLGGWHLDNQVTLQQSSSDFVRIPPIYSTHSLYYEGDIFKKAAYAKIGLDLRLNSPYSPYGFQPLNGQFIIQDNQTLNWQPITDAFLAVKVKKFRFLLRYGNFLPLLTRKDYYYQVADYPVPHGYLRFAIAWQFID